MTKPKIFLCHSSKDKEFVEQIAKDLNDHGVDVWYDKWEIKVGDSIIQKINSGIEDSSHMGMILSPHSIESNWVKKEFDAGLIKEIDTKKVVLLPILFKKCLIPTIIKSKMYANFTNGYQEGLKELLNVFNVNTREISKGQESGHLFVDTLDYDNVIETNIIE